MQKILIDYLETLSLGRKQSYKNLAVYPLISDYDVALAYLILDEALQKEIMDVVEVDDAGEVPQLKVVNRADQMVLILDGEELVGAKQNRIVNTTILIAANATTVIPVSCVEQGRWSYSSSKFSSRKRIMPHGLRAMKAMDVQHCLKRTGKFQADQSAIWQEVSGKAQRLNSESETMDMDFIYEKQAPALNKYIQYLNLSLIHI